MNDMIACSDEDDEGLSGQGSVSQPITGMFALGVLYDSSNSQVALGEPLSMWIRYLCKENTYLQGRVFDEPTR